MRIQDFADMEQFESIMNNWAKATGLATVAVGADGKYISKCYNFTDFCIKLTRGSEEGCRRCEKCDREGKGIYHCHAGLIDFGIDLVVKGEKLGSIIGGQVLPEHPDEEKFRQVAREIGVDEDDYIKALKSVNIKSEESITASATLLGAVLNSFINAQYNDKYNTSLLEKLSNGAAECEALLKNIEEVTKQLDNLQKKQNILALNANIEAARAGDAGRGFSVVATEVGKSAVNCSDLNRSISKYVDQISTVIHKMTSVANISNENSSTINTNNMK